MQLRKGLLYILFRFAKAKRSPIFVSMPWADLTDGPMRLHMTRRRCTPGRLLCKVMTMKGTAQCLIKLAITYI